MYRRQLLQLFPDDCRSYSMPDMCNFSEASASLSNSIFQQFTHRAWADCRVHVLVCECVLGLLTVGFPPGVLTKSTTSSSFTLISFLLAWSQPIRVQHHKGSGHCQCNHRKQEVRNVECHFHSYTLIQMHDIITQQYSKGRRGFGMPPLVLVGIDPQIICYIAKLLLSMLLSFSRPHMLLHMCFMIFLMFCSPASL